MLVYFLQKKKEKRKQKEKEKEKLENEDKNVGKEENKNAVRDLCLVNLFTWQQKVNAQGYRLNRLPVFCRILPKVDFIMGGTTQAS